MEWVVLIFLLAGGWIDNGMYNLIWYQLAQALLVHPPIMSILTYGNNPDEGQEEFIIPMELLKYPFRSLFSFACYRPNNFTTIWDKSPPFNFYRNKKLLFFFGQIPKHMIINNINRPWGKKAYWI